MNVVTRSGTNKLHGSASEFVRNNYLDAVNFFATCKPVAPATTCTAKDTLHQYATAGTLGGKILRDKLFVFGGYQFFKAIQATDTTTAHVPTAANLAGDFSVTDPAPGTTITSTSCATKTIQMFDPLTGAILPGNKYATPPTWNAQALKLQAYLPPTSDPCGLVGYAIPSQVYDKQFVTRVDYTINAKNDMYGRYFLDGYQAPAFFSPTNVLLTTNPGNIERVQTGAIGEVYTITPQTINTFHASVSRRVDVRGPAPGINACTIGITLSCPLPSGLQITVGSTATHGFSAYCGTCAPGHFNDNSLAIADDVTMMRGKHQILFGGEYVRNQLNIVGAFQADGNFTINGQYSANGPGGGAAIGDANLDFLLGAMSGFSQSKTQQNALRAPIPSLYVQDTYHASKQLTIVAGLRWSPEYFPVDYFNRGSIFNMSAFLANQVSSVYPTAPAGSFFYGDPGVSRQFTSSSPWQFSPNFGASWDPNGNGKTVLRAGAEIAYDEVNFFTGQRVNQNPPFATSSSPNTTGQLSFSSPWTVNGVTSSPYPQPGIPDKATAVFPAQGQFIVLPTQFHPSYTIQYTASIQHQFGRGWELQLDYIGNGTRHAPIGSPLNDAVFIPGVWGPNGTGCSSIVRTGPAAVTPGAAGTSCSTTANQKSRFALAIANPAQGNQYQGGGGGSVLVSDFATANYNGLVTTHQHRLSSSFSLLANHTWSKCLNIADAAGDVAGSPVQNPNNIASDYGPCGSDFRNIENVVITTKSNFPMTGFKALILNNWEFAPLLHIQSGAPFTVTSGQDNSFTAVGNDRPNQLPGVPVYARVAFRNAAGAANRTYVNQSAFQQVTITAGCAAPFSGCSANGTYGNVGRNSFRGIPSYQLDSQISRIFAIRERLNMVVRLEAFNMLNHPNFNIPTGSTTGSLGGTSGGNAVVTSSTFGQITSTSNTARVFQGGVKVSF